MSEEGDAPEAGGLALWRSPAANRAVDVLHALPLDDEKV